MYDVDGGEKWKQNGGIEFCMVCLSFSLACFKQASSPPQLSREMAEMALRAVHVQDEAAWQYLLISLGVQPALADQGASSLCGTGEGLAKAQ